MLGRDVLRPGSSGSGLCGSGFLLRREITTGLLFNVVAVGLRNWLRFDPYLKRLRRDDDPQLLRGRGRRVATFRALCSLSVSCLAN